METSTLDHINKFNASRFVRAKRFIAERYEFVCRVKTRHTKSEPAMLS